MFDKGFFHGLVFKRPGTLRRVAAARLFLAALTPLDPTAAVAGDGAPEIETCVMIDPGLDPFLETVNGTRLYRKRPSETDPGYLLVAPRIGCNVKVPGVGEPIVEPLDFTLKLKDGEPVMNRYYPASIGALQKAVFARIKKRCRNVPVEAGSGYPTTLERGSPPTAYETCIARSYNRLAYRADVVSLITSSNEFYILIAVFRGCLVGYSVQRRLDFPLQPATHESPEGVGKCRI